MIAAVLAFQAFHLFGLHVSKDLPLWDESAYLGWGDEFRQDGKVGSITNAPFYHVLYAGVISAVGLLPSFFVMQYALKLLLTALVVLLACRFSRSASFGLLIGVAFAYSHYHLNIDVLVYYAALIPFCLSILVCRQAPVLSLGLSFLAGLGRLEYMAVPLCHLVGLAWIRRTPPARAERPRWGTAITAGVVWAFNAFLLTRVTVWQFHNRVWFAWSQNYAYFRVQTGRDAGINPWLDHPQVTERDFPGASSLVDALSTNARAFLEHVWFNLRELPGYLGDFLVAHQNAADARFLPVVLLSPLVVAAGWAFVRYRPTWDELRQGLNSLKAETVLCFGGVIAAGPGFIISSKTNYIMSMLPAALLVLGAAHRLAGRTPGYARWSGPAWLACAVVYASFTFTRPLAYTTKAPHGPVYDDVVTIRRVLAPFRGLTLLGVSTASYINYLGREKGHVFVEPLAINPANPQATDLTLAGLIRARNPHVLLINSQWRSSQSFAATMEGFTFEGWDAHPLRDGTLYVRQGLAVEPQFGDGWYAEETAPGRRWRWSRGAASLELRNSIPERPVTLQFRLRTVGTRKVEVSWNGRSLFSRTISPDAARDVAVTIDVLPLGASTVHFETDQPAVRPGNHDSRELAFSVENLVVRDQGTKPAGSVAR